MKILLVEDNIVNQKIADAMIQKMGFCSVIAANGQEALDELRKGGYSLVFMDIQMPVMDGYEATRAIRAAANESFRDIPIVAMTANAMTGDRETCLASGMNDYIAKPISIGMVSEMIRKWHTG